MSFKTHGLDGREVEKISRSTTQVVGDNTQYRLDCPDCGVNVPFSTIEAVVDPKTGKQRDKYRVRGVNGGRANCPLCDKPVIVIAERSSVEYLRNKGKTFYTKNRRFLSRRARINEIKLPPVPSET